MNVVAARFEGKSRERRSVILLIIGGSGTPSELKHIEGCGVPKTRPNTSATFDEIVNAEARNKVPWQRTNRVTVTITNGTELFALAQPPKNRLSSGARREPSYRRAVVPLRDRVNSAVAT